MPADIDIRKATDGDIQEIASLWGEVLAHHAPFNQDLILGKQSEDSFAEFLPARLGDPESLVLLAEKSGAPVGFGIVQIKTRPPIVKARRYGFISDLGVTPSHRRSGIGAALLERLLTWLRDADINGVELGVHAQNTVGLAFWHKQGFEVSRHTMSRPVG